ncbi:helix-turn-helix domain-containing protein [Streptomyces sp. GS7]|uniref:helix-turn-helix domain-containing protein n=1 Tax=Streptomyces sp. GS7 TaxID=2692234 RepID=UPI001316DEE0|nr:helix-turn-helix domain-containing protein [Streptomyces sp. GS7]QHC23627.1 helix-turn-helix domain-containing protein [Streptomyces sp. GS7]
MLPESVFRSEDFPAGDRFEVWRDLIGRTHAPVELSCDVEADHRAHQRVLELGAIRVWPATTYRLLGYHRTLKMVRRSDPEQYHLALPLMGVNRLSWDDRKAEFGPYELHLYDSSQVFDAYTVNDHGCYSGVGVEVPKALLPLPPGRVDRLFGRAMPGRQGVGALLTQFLLQVVNDSGSYQPCDGPRLEPILTDLIAALFAHTLDADNHLTPESRRRTLALRIQAFIRQRLGDPGLTPRTVAAAHHISVSYLHRLFEGEHETVAAMIRRLRLERARRDLADRALSDTPIHAVATRWGFPRAAEFSRVFRAAYDVAPRDYREQARQR